MGVTFPGLQVSCDSSVRSVTLSDVCLFLTLILKKKCDYISRTYAAAQLWRRSRSGGQVGPKCHRLFREDTGKWAGLAVRQPPHTRPLSRLRPRVTEGSGTIEWRRLGRSAFPSVGGRRLLVMNAGKSVCLAAWRSGKCSRPDHGQPVPGRHASFISTERKPSRPRSPRGVRQPDVALGFWLPPCTYWLDTHSPMTHFLRLQLPDL